jgi:hypothetical protein
LLLGAGVLVRVVLERGRGVRLDGALGGGRLKRREAGLSERCGGFAEGALARTLVAIALALLGGAFPPLP